MKIARQQLEDKDIHRKETDKQQNALSNQE